MSHIHRIRRAIAVAFAATLVAVGATAPAAAAPANRNPVKVMTRNLYLGADLQPAIAATTVPQLLAAGAHIFSVVQQTNFPERAVALAREFRDADPHLIGLQEVALWYSGPLGDPAPATTVEYDFLQSLLAELEAAGSPYDVVRTQAEADIEGPAGAPYFRDFRLVQRDVVLVKRGADAQLTNIQSANFVNRLVITTGTGQQIPVDRGWVSVDVTVNKRTFRFVNTHLEAFHPLVRLEQARELIASTGPVGAAPGNVVLVGDINSGPDLPVPANRLAFQALADFGLVDTWRTLYPTVVGNTSGFGELLDEPLATALTNRIDLVLTLGDVGLVRAKIYGTDEDNLTASGMWPSDHAGVLTTLLP